MGFHNRLFLKRLCECRSCHQLLRSRGALVVLALTATPTCTNPDWGVYTMVPGENKIPPVKFHTLNTHPSTYFSRQHYSTVYQPSQPGLSGDIT
ncbi:hypothetical protein LY78DRAFT_659969 [Colletotrichum sublineola]|nr:hypothetical protein LY78DRAFT_659969 [Colletotrichum sublineola]